MPSSAELEFPGDVTSVPVCLPGPHQNVSAQKLSAGMQAAFQSAPRLPDEKPGNEEGLSTPGRRFLWPLALLIAAVLLWLVHQRSPEALQRFAEQFRQLTVWTLLCGVASLYFSFGLRAVRWSVLLGPVRKTGWAELLAPQLIGFTAVAIFGRAADLTRPFLVARRLRTPVAMQLAVYSIERAFDLGAAAILFSVTLAFAPRNLLHHEAYTRAGLLALLATLFLAAVACAVRLVGDSFARVAASALRPLSPRLAETVARRLLDLQEGFGTLASFRQFAAALAVSLLMWVGIAVAYMESARAFRSSPPLAAMSFAGIMLLLATSLGASLLQLPVLGWFTQIAALAAAYHAFYGVPLQTASACGTVTLLIANLSVIPGGLIAAQIQGVALRQARPASPGPDDRGGSSAPHA